MATRKKAPQTSKSAFALDRKSARVETGAVPPYGEAIHKAMARGELQELKRLSKSTRKWLDEVNSALAKLDAKIKKAGG